jgi:hypothetical protein
MGRTLVSERLSHRMRRCVLSIILRPWRVIELVNCREHFGPQAPLVWTLARLKTLKPNGQAAACKAAQRGFDSRRRLFPGKVN